MKSIVPVLAICAGTVLLAAGCNKKDNPPLSQAAQQAPSAQGPAATPPAPPLPEAVVPKGAEAPSPLPGQAGDTSSEVFKGGGKQDPHK